MFLNSSNAKNNPSKQGGLGVYNSSTNLGQDDWFKTRSLGYKGFIYLDSC